MLIIIFWGDKIQNYKLKIWMVLHLCLKKMYFQNTKNNDEIANKSIHNKLINLLENNILDIIDDYVFINQEKLEDDIN